MTRRKNHNRSHEQKKTDKTPINLNSSASRIKKFNSDPRGQIPAKIILENRTPKSIYYTNNEENHLIQSTPGLFDVSYKKDGFIVKNCSFELVPRVPRLKLNLDIPEDDSNQKNSAVKYEEEYSVKKKLTEKSDNLLQSPKNNNEFLKIPDSVERKTKEINEKNIESSNMQNQIINYNELITPGTDNLNLITNMKWSSPQILPQLDLNKICSPKSSKKLVSNSIFVPVDKKAEHETSLRIFPSTEKLNTSFVKVKDENFNSLSAKEVQKIEEKQYLINSQKELSSESKYQTFKTIFALPQQNTYIDLSTLRPHCKLFRQSSLILKKLKIHFPKVSDVCSWISKKIRNFIKQIYANSSQNISPSVPLLNSKPTETQNCNEILSALRSESDKIITVLSEKVMHLSEELNQVRATNEVSLTVFTKEIIKIQDANEKLVENSSELVKELKSLHQTLKNIQPPSKNSLSTPLPPPTLTFPLQTPSLPTPLSSIPPPPPPPPPPPFPIQSANNLKTPKTPNSGRKLKSKTPNKSLSASSNRPSITVDDLLKVTLKKAPRINKENRRNTVPGPKGPAISLDMLRSVKLRSAGNEPTKNRQSAFLSNRSNSSPKISISTTSKSPLSSILKQVDINRPRKRQILTCPTQSDTDLINATATSRNRFRLNRSQSSVGT